jgi:hypothetical protein
MRPRPSGTESVPDLPLVNADCSGLRTVLSLNFDQKVRRLFLLLPQSSRLLTFVCHRDRVFAFGEQLARVVHQGLNGSCMPASWTETARRC